MSPAGVFEPVDGGFLPTDAARGPWNPGMLHGGAVGALLAGLLDHPEQVTTRIVVELLGPVPAELLAADVEPTEGGRRVMRQSATLRAGDRPVARAMALRMRRADLDLPARATAHPVVFDPTAVPALDAPIGQARDSIGWDCFDTLAVAMRFGRGRSEGRARTWLRLLLPIVAGRPASPLATVVAAADYASAGTSLRLDFADWSFMNADLVVSLRRPASGGWIGLESDGYLAATGTGQSVATIHDHEGLVGQSSQSLLIEPR